MFADAAAKAESHLRCQKADRAELEPWFSSHCDACWQGFLEKNPGTMDTSRKDALVAAARELICENWDTVIVVATAYAAPSIDIQGREFEFLDRFR